MAKNISPLMEVKAAVAPATQAEVVMALAEAVAEAAVVVEHSSLACCLPCIPPWAGSLLDMALLEGLSWTLLHRVCLMTSGDVARCRALVIHSDDTGAGSACVRYSLVAHVLLRNPLS